jgi:acyl carrier protein
MIQQGSDVRARLIAIVGELLGSASALPEPFPVDRQLSDLGVSSLKMVNLMLAVEAAFDIAIPQEDITPDNFHSVEAIEHLVARTLARGVAA